MGQLTFLGPKYNVSRLVAYGIQTESSTHRMHIDAFNKFAYVFKTKDGLKMLPEPIIPTSPYEWDIPPYRLIHPEWLKDEHKDLATSRGVKIDWRKIPGCTQYPIPEEYLPSDLPKGTSSKGNIGVTIASKMLGAGLINMQFEIIEIKLAKEQISGIDLTAAPIKIQVKYDLYSTRNGLFLQTHEANLYKWH